MTLVNRSMIVQEHSAFIADAFGNSLENPSICVISM